MTEVPIRKNNCCFFKANITMKQLNRKESMSVMKRQNNILSSWGFFFVFVCFLFFSQPFANRKTTGEGGCHFYPFHRHLDITREGTAESSPLHIANDRVFLSFSVSVKFGAYYITGQWASP